MNFSKDLLRWYHRNKRDLPWRGIWDPYQTWISEIMLQQTTVAAVIPKFRAWVALFPTMESLAEAPLQRVLKAWQGLGYYNRAKNLHRAAQMMCCDHAGCVPADRESLLALPGLGPYTAAAVLSIAYDQRIPVIDANVRRVMMRVLALPGRADPGKDKIICRYLEKVFPLRAAGNFNQAMMELGALVCDQRKPLCLKCPLRPYCQACRKGIQETIPETIKKQLIEIFAVVALIQKGRRYLIQQRPAHGLLGDLWEFPGGKIEHGETSRQALVREIQEELGVVMEDARHYMKTRHFYTEYKVHLDVWQCTLERFPVLSERQRWVLPAEFPLYPFVSGSVKIIETLRKD